MNDGPWTRYWLNSSKIAELREDLFDVLRYADRTGLLNPRQAGHGQGIVFAAGNSVSSLHCFLGGACGQSLNFRCAQDTFERVRTSMRLLRSAFNVSLPAEVFSFPDEHPSDELAAELEELGVQLRTVDFKKDEGKLKSYHLKASAVLQSAFREVLFLDSDNYPAANVETLFQSKAYKRLGAFFWPDYWKESPVNPVWQLIGVQCRDEWTQEAGIFVINKALHLDVLTMVDYMLKRHEVYYEFSDGDKDLFRFAMLALRKRWAVPGRIRMSCSSSQELRNPD